MILSSDTAPILEEDQQIRSRVLIAEDDMVSCRLLESTLRKWGHEVVVTCDGREAWKVLQEDNPPEIAILDWVMPVMEGPEVCARLRELGRTTYAILLTGKNSKDDIVRGLDAGADDYVSKPFDPHELRARLRVGERMVKLQKALAVRVGQLEALAAKLEDLSYVDQLTGIPNRRQLDDLLDREWRRALRLGMPLTAVMIDIDSFKTFNDHYGHPAGDVCLHQVATALSGCLMRASDSLGRYGGEEFLALLPGTEMTGSLQVAQALRKAVEDLQIPHLYSKRGQRVVTVSLGLALHCPGQDSDPQTLVSWADNALYLAKEAGGNQVKVVTEKTKSRKSV
ncbi:diguanylate cyclase [bacterium]|nr:diguanylate cyclase [bacterium]